MCKVEKLSEPELTINARPIYYKELDNGCHLCVSHRHDRDGYSRVDRRGREWLMHRYIFFINHGDIPARIEVRHKCDHPYCINRDHLELGTHRDNMGDIVLRNRPRKVPRRLNDKESQFIREHQEMTIPELAKTLNVSNATIIIAKRKMGIKKKLSKVDYRPSIRADRKKQKNPDNKK